MEVSTTTIRLTVTMCCAVSKFVMNEWCSIEEVYAAYLDCKKRKSKSTSYTRFAANEAANIYSLWEDLNNRTYTIGRSDAFCVTRPKVREVFAAQFRDRIVHHLLMLRLLQYFEGVFIEDTYNCRKNKGTDYGICRIAGYMQSNPDKWVLKCDIKHFFMNINKQLLADRLDEFIRGVYKREDIDEVIALVRQIVMHRPELNCIRKGDLELWDVLPKGKSLFKSDGNHGLAIGNLTSQIFANFYLTPLDDWLGNMDEIKYGRYVDDFVLIGDRDVLLELLPKIRDKLKTIGLTLHPDKIYLQPIRHGMTFLGSVIKHDRLYAGNRTVSNAYEVARGYDRVKNKEEYIEKFAQRYNSYMGYLIYKKSYAIRWDIWNEVADEAKQYVYMTNGLAVMKVRNRYKEQNKLIECYGKKHRKQKRIRRDSSCIYPQ